MLKLFMIILTVFVPTVAICFDIKCTSGASCIRTQGTMISADKAIAMSGACNDFTQNDIGKLALKFSQQEIFQRTNGKPMHPLNVAVWAFDQLRDSPLQFERKARMEETNYYEIKKSCVELNRDFNDNSKWDR